MEYRINETELAVLACLHEGVEGYGPRHAVDMVSVAGEMSADPTDVRKAVSYLEGWGLVGVAADLATYETEAFPPIYLTSQGEAYMREVDEKAAEAGLVNRGKRLGVAGLKAAGEAAVKIGTAVLTEVAKGMLKGG